jgi:hypothetical protein
MIRWGANQYSSRSGRWLAHPLGCYYLFQTFIFGLLIIKSAGRDGVGWLHAGRLMANRGLLIGSLLTAVVGILIIVVLIWALRQCGRCTPGLAQHHW